MRKRCYYPTFPPKKASQPVQLENHTQAQVYMCTAKFKPRVGPYLDEEAFLSEENNFKRFRRVESTMS